jgi:hypothetical protein
MIVVYSLIDLEDLRLSYLSGLTDVIAGKGVARIEEVLRRIVQEATHSSLRKGAQRCLAAIHGPYSPMSAAWWQRIAPSVALVQRTPQAGFVVSQVAHLVIGFLAAKHCEDLVLSEDFVVRLLPEPWPLRDLLGSLEIGEVLPAAIGEAHCLVKIKAFERLDEPISQRLAQDEREELAKLRSWLRTAMKRPGDLGVIISSAG